MNQLDIDMLSEEWIEGGNQEVLEGIRVPGKEAPSFETSRLFRLALYEEMKQMQERARLGSEIAHGFAEELTLYLSKLGS
jgi:hypothetical protein